MKNAERLAIGTVQFGTAYGISNATGQVPLSGVRAILDRSRSLGISLLDTAEGYGEAEAVLGQAGVGDFRIVSKLGRFDAAPSDVFGQIHQRVERMLVRLGLPRLHGLMLHAPAQLLEDAPLAAEVLRALEALVAQKLVGRIGVSAYDPATTRQLREMFDFSLIQVPLCPIDDRWDQDGILTTLDRSGVEIHARSAFLQGLLLMPPAELPGWATPWRPLLSGFQDWVRARCDSLAAGCVALSLGRPEIDHLVLGILDTAQLDEAAAAAGLYLDPATLPKHLKSVDPQLLEPSRWPT